MDKNKMIGVVVVVGLVAALYFLVFKGDSAPDYAGAADADACAALDPVGVWTDATGTEGEPDYVAGSCAAPAAPTCADNTDADACAAADGCVWTDAVEDNPDTDDDETAAASCGDE